MRSIELEVSQVCTGDVVSMPSENIVVVADLVWISELAPATYSEQSSMNAACKASQWLQNMEPVMTLPPVSDCPSLRHTTLLNVLSRAASPITDSHDN